VFSVDLLRRYWNRSDLLAQLRKASVILVQDRVSGGFRHLRERDN